MNTLNNYDFTEGIEFNGLMEAVAEASGVKTIGSGQLQVIDFIGTAFPDDGGSTPTPEPEPEPEPQEVDASFDYIFDEQSWNTAYSHEALQNYYEDHPEEDCWNQTANRACNYNDRLYKGTIDDETVNGQATWESDNAQKISIGNDVYYAQIFYGFDPQTIELYTDAELTNSTGKEFVITTVCYSEDCPHCWQGAINAPGAKYPWCVVTLPIPFDGTIKFVYDETNVVERTANTEHGYYIEAIPTLFGEEYKLDENGDTTFDSSKLNVTLITQ